MTEKPIVKQLDTLLYRIGASQGSPMFQTVCATYAGKDVDLTRKGQVSCAVYVSALLVLAEALPRMCATVHSLERQLKENGWQKTDTLFPGAVLVWEPTIQADDKRHAHAGFFVGGDVAYSHSDSKCSPVEHHYTFGVDVNRKPQRNITAIYIYPAWYEKEEEDERGSAGTGMETGDQVHHPAEQTL